MQNPEISLLLLDDLRITQLNKDYLNRNRPTDVISFPMHDDSFPEVQPQLLGDVVISVETAARQALQNQCTLHEEILVLLIHGILHLLGYDHEQTAREKKRMQTKEKELLKKVTISNKNRKALKS